MNNKKGFTLVEVIAAFMLTAVLLSVSAFVLAAYSKVYTRVNAMSKAENVAATVGDELYGQLFLANGHVTVSADNTSVSYISNDNFNMSLYAENGRLTVHYDEVIDPESKAVLTPAVDWFYPEETYMGNTLTSLLFYTYEGTNVIKAVFTLRNNLTGVEFSTEKFIRCYNVDPSFIKTA